MPVPDTVLGTALAVALVCAVVLGLGAALHPDGAAWLRRWGLPSPTPEQAHVVRRHLRERRLWTVLAYLALGALVTATTPPGDEPGTPRLLGSLLVGLLVGELVAVWRQRRDQVARAAPVPAPRPPSLPRWPLHLLRAAFALACLLTVSTLALAAWWRSDLSVAARAESLFAGLTVDREVELGVPAVAAVVVLVELVVRLATGRPAGPDTDEAVDLLLRARTARVALGVGVAAIGVVLIALAEQLQLQVLHLRGTAQERVAEVVTSASTLVGVAGAVGGIVVWVLMANQPSRRARTTAPAAA